MKLADAAVRIVRLPADEPLAAGPSVPGAVREIVTLTLKTDQGIDFLTQEDADRLAGEDADYHQRDLYTSIEDGNFPSGCPSVCRFPSAVRVLSEPNAAPP